MGSQIAYASNDGGLMEEDQEHIKQSTPAIQRIDEHTVRYEIVNFPGENKYPGVYYTVSSGESNYPGSISPVIISSTTEEQAEGLGFSVWGGFTWGKVTWSTSPELKSLIALKEELQQCGMTIEDVRNILQYVQSLPESFVQVGMLFFRGQYEKSIPAVQGRPIEPHKRKNKKKPKLTER